MAIEVAASDITAYDRLRSHNFWMDSRGRIMHVQEMSQDHLANAMGWLLSNAKRYEREYTIAEMRRKMDERWHPLDYFDEFHDYLHNRKADPERFIRSTPIYHSMWNEYFLRKAVLTPQPVYPPVPDWSDDQWLTA